MNKLLAVVITLGALLLNPTFAMEVKANIHTFDVAFNETKIENKNRQFPLLVYKDITYVPMTYYDSRYLGLISNWENETNTLSIEKDNITCAYRDYNWEWKNSNRNQAYRKIKVGEIEPIE